MLGNIRWELSNKKRIKMSIIHVNQIATKVEELFSEHINVDDMNVNDPEFKTKLLTRCLAAYAVYRVGDASEVDSADSIVDGGDDNGIDAIHYSTITKRMIIVQSKWSKKGVGEPDSGDIRKFKDGVVDLFNLEFDRFNNKVKSKQASIEKALTDYDTKFDIVIIHTGNQLLSKHSQRVMDDLLQEMNETGDENKEDILVCHQLNQGVVHSSLASGVEGEPIDLEVGLSQWGKVDEPQSAFYGMIAGEEVASWWESNGKRLFAKNIRQMLGTTEVNEEIRETLDNNAENFWYFNNGITVVADSIRKSAVGGNSRDLGSFRVINMSVVNGAQTVSTIGRYKEEDGKNLAKVKLPIRIISLEGANEHFGAEVTKTNNRQNRIENRDFVSQDEEQIRIRKELSIEEVDYNIVRSDSFKPSDNSFDLSEATVALACASGEVSLAVQAKREIGKFYENLSKAPYRVIFNPQVSGIYVLNSVKTLRQIEEVISIEISKLEKKSGKYYGLLVHGNRMIALLSMKELLVSREAKNYDYVVAGDVPEKVQNVILKTNDFVTEKYPDKVLGTLFKNTSICKELYQNCI
jgi:hypothetical protein